MATSLATLACGEYGRPEIAPPRGVEVGRARAGHRGGHVGQQEAQPLVVDDLAAERRSLVGVGDGLVQRGLRQPDRHRGDAQPTGIQCAERDLQALALRADAAVGFDVGVVVERRRGRDGVQAHLLLGLAEGQPGEVAGHQEARDARDPSPVRANNV